MKSTYTAGKTILASSVFLGMAFGTAHAEICYKLNPFIDVIRVAQTNFVDEAPNGSHRLGTLHDGDCLGHSDVTLNGVPGGPWNLSCDGGVPGIFNNSGTPLNVVSCDSVGPSGPVVGKSATQP
jgi:hypothetical protein